MNRRRPRPRTAPAIGSLGKCLRFEAAVSMVGIKCVEMMAM
jgi:hypothetical protein